MDLKDVFPSVISALSLIVAILIAFRYKKQAEISSRLEHQLNRLNTALDQSLKLLYSAREATIKKHQSEIFLSQWVSHTQGKGMTEDGIEIYSTKFAEFSASWAELRGLAFAIGDKELLELVNSFPQTPKESAFFLHEGNLRNQTQQILTRIAKLVEQTILENESATV